MISPNCMLLLLYILCRSLNVITTCRECRCRCSELHGVQCADSAGSGGGPRQDGGCLRGSTVCCWQRGKGQAVAQVAMEEVGLCKMHSCARVSDREQVQLVRVYVGLHDSEGRGRESRTSTELKPRTYVL